MHWMLFFFPKLYFFMMSLEACITFCHLIKSDRLGNSSVPLVCLSQATTSPHPPPNTLPPLLISCLHFSFQDNGHKEDILSIAVSPPNLLATSSYDGEVRFLLMLVVILSLHCDARSSSGPSCSKPD